VVPPYVGEGEGDPGGRGGTAVPLDVGAHAVLNDQRSTQSAAPRAPPLPPPPPAGPAPGRAWQLLLVPGLCALSNYLVTKYSDESLTCYITYLPIQLTWLTDQALAKSCSALRTLTSSCTLRSLVS